LISSSKQILLFHSKKKSSTVRYGKGRYGSSTSSLNYKNDDIGTSAAASIDRFQREASKKRAVDVDCILTIHNKR
jgi:hypothetical protein